MYANSALRLAPAKHFFFIGLPCVRWGKQFPLQTHETKQVTLLITTHNWCRFLHSGFLHNLHPDIPKISASNRANRSQCSACFSFTCGKSIGLLLLEGGRSEGVAGHGLLRTVRVGHDGLHVVCKGVAVEAQQVIAGPSGAWCRGDGRRRGLGCERVAGGGRRAGGRGGRQLLQTLLLHRKQQLHDVKSPGWGQSGETSIITTSGRPVHVSSPRLPLTKPTCLRQSTASFVAQEIGSLFTLAGHVNQRQRNKGRVLILSRSTW